MQVLSKQISLCFNLFVLLFLVTPYVIVAVQPCMEWILIIRHHIGSLTQEFLICTSFDDGILLLPQIFCLVDCFCFFLIFWASHSKKGNISLIWVLCALNWFSAAYVTFGMEFLSLSSSTRRIVSDSFYIYLWWMIFYGVGIVFQNFWVCHSFCHTLSSLHTRCFLRDSFRLRGKCFCWYNCIFGCSELLVYLLIL